MKPIAPFIDIHCHILPCLDDGAASLGDALAMARMAVADGTKTIVATPHQLGNHVENTAASIRQATFQFQRHLDSHHVPLRVLPGADVRIEPDLVQRIRRDEIVTLGNHRRHVLLELPHSVYLPIDPLLSELQAAGLVGILSHPERNRGILRRPDVLKHWVQHGCLMQATAGSFTGLFGQHTQRFSEWMLEQGLIHIVATDAHGPTTRPPSIRPAFDRISELVGEERALIVCCRNPARVSRGALVPANPYEGIKSSKHSIFTKLPWLAFFNKRRKVA